MRKKILISVVDFFGWFWDVYATVFTFYMDSREIWHGKVSTVPFHVIILCNPLGSQFGKVRFFRSSKPKPKPSCSLTNMDLAISFLRSVWTETHWNPLILVIESVVMAQAKSLNGRQIRWIPMQIRRSGPQKWNQVVLITPRPTHLGYVVSYSLLLAWFSWWQWIFLN